MSQEDLIPVEELAPAEVAELDLYQKREKIYTRKIEGFFQRVRLFTGWPLLIAVHGLPATKQAAAARAADFAQRGYLVVAYDVRGQGSGIALNPGKGSGIMSLQEWIDMFEVIEWARSTYPNLVDNQRVGVFGVRQGGAHAWAAAALSGRQPPPTPRR